MESNSDTKRVAKNTLLLYIRMFVMMGIGLFTSRVSLQALGIDNYGIYNAIGGFLSLFGIITSSISAAIGRFITVELGKRQLDRLKLVFSTSVVVQLCLSILIIILIETVGIWFVETQMNIPAGRETAARWCLHCATVATLIGMTNVPFMSAIIAHEKMSAFAFMTIFDAIWKLLICYLIIISPIDKLITYSVLLVIVQIFTTSIYWIYSLRKFEECTFQLRYDKKIFKEMWSFGGWTFFGNTAWILNTQGVNMLMNIFFGVVVNAARAVAVQVNGIVSQFVENFMVALRPQITKSYASGDKETAFKLACQGARFSFYIMFMISLPLMIEAKQVLQIWLGNPPENAHIFVIWTILSTFTTLLGSTLLTLMMAHGSIRRYQIIITIVGCMVFPITWIAFRLGATAIYAYYIFVFIYWVLIFVRYYLVHEKTGIPAKMYLIGVIGRTHLIALISAIIPMIIYSSMTETFIRLIAVIAGSIIPSAIFIYYWGITASERVFIKTKIFAKLKLARK